MAVLYCSRCSRFHPSDDECRPRRGSSSRSTTLPGAVLHGVLLGVVAGTPFGALTQHPAPFLIVAVLVLVGRLAWYFVKERG